jgi:hypothetical protein
MSSDHVWPEAGKDSICLHSLYDSICIVHTLRYSNMAMEHLPFLEAFHSETSIYRGFPTAMFDYLWVCEHDSMLSKDWSVLHHLVREVSWISRNSRTISRIWKLGCGPGTRLNMPRTSIPKVLQISREIHLAWARLYPLYRSLSLFWVDLVYVENELVGAFDFVFPSEISIVPPNPPNR